MILIHIQPSYSFEAYHLPPPFPNLPDLLPRFLRRDPDILIKILQALMPADLHNKLRGCTGQELIRAKRPTAGMRGDQGILRLNGYHILVALLIGYLDGSIDARELADLLDIPV